MKLSDFLFYEEPGVQLYCGDSLAILPELAENSADACVTDPPYGLEFMGKEWDKLGPSKTDHVLLGFLGMVPCLRQKVLAL